MELKSFVREMLLSEERVIRKLRGVSILSIGYSFFWFLELLLKVLPNNEVAA